MSVGVAADSVARIAEERWRSISRSRSATSPARPGSTSSASATCARRCPPSSITCRWASRWGWSTRSCGCCSIGTPRSRSDVCWSERCTTTATARGSVVLEGTLKQIGALPARRKGYRYFACPPETATRWNRPSPRRCSAGSRTRRPRPAPASAGSVATDCSTIPGTGRRWRGRRWSPTPRWSLAEPVVESACGTCRQCVEACPAAAITGRPWRRDDGMVSLVDADRCRQVLVENERLAGSWACGRCAVACALAKLTERSTE